jgi:hypothetical protein
LVTTGSVLPGTITLMFRVAVVNLPPLSVMRAVMTCAPVLSELTFSDAPVPSRPSRLEVQLMPLLMVPSSTSVAAPEKVTVAPWKAWPPSQCRNSGMDDDPERESGQCG